MSQAATQKGINAVQGTMWCDVETMQEVVSRAVEVLVLDPNQSTLGKGVPYFFRETRHHDNKQLLCQTVAFDKEC